MCLRLTFWVRKGSYRQLVLMEGAGTVFKVLMLGANPLVRDNALILLRAMAYHCVFAPSLKEALVLHEKEKPDAAILDAQQVDSSPAESVTAFHRKLPGLRGRTIVLTGEHVLAQPEMER